MAAAEERGVFSYQPARPAGEDDDGDEDFQEASESQQPQKQVCLCDVQLDWEIFFIHWTFDFVYFVGREIHEFKIPTKYYSH